MRINLKNRILAKAMLALLTAGSVSWGQTRKTQTNANVAHVKKLEQPSNDFSLLLGIEYSQKVAVDQQGERETGTDVLLLPSYKINDLLKVAAKAVVTKENSGARQTSFSNTQFILAITGAQLSDTLSTLHSISVVAPTNEDSQKRDRLKTSLAVSNGLRFVNEVFKADYKLVLSKNVHEYNINAEGNPNVEYRLSNALELTLSLTDKLSIVVSGIYKLGRTYEGFERTDYEISSDINYDILENLSVNLGTTSDGDALKSNGVDSNITAYNENTSAIRAGVSFKF